MLIDKNHADILESFLKKIKLNRTALSKKGDKEAKIGQILSYLEVLDSQIRKMSTKRKLILVESAAGNCYLSFLIYFYYTEIHHRKLEIHCIDTNEKLMRNSQLLAKSLSFDKMYFYSHDILDFKISNDADICYTLHACDMATDKALYLGIRSNAKCILSVSCCQHSLASHLRNKALKGVTRYKSFKNKILYMIADTMRAHLLQMKGYKVDIFDFTSSRNTDKNIMIRAKKGGVKQNNNLANEYKTLYAGFNIKPELENYISNQNLINYK